MMTLLEFMRTFDSGGVAPSGFHHVDHLRLAWAYLDDSPSFDAATDRMRNALQRFAASVGRSDKYSDPVTIFWMRELAAARAAMPDAGFDAVLEAFPQLLDQSRACL